MYRSIVQLLNMYSSKGVFFWCKGAIEGFLYDVWPEWIEDKKIPMRLFKTSFWRNFSEETRTTFFDLALKRKNKQFRRLMQFLNTEFPLLEEEIEKV